MDTNMRCCSHEENNELRRGPWTLDEDTLLIHCISSHGEGRWNLLANLAGLKRTGKSCRLRWLNYLKPDIKRGKLTPQEQLLILELHSKWGNRWSRIAQNLPGRTDNEIKNYWRTRVQKQARALNIDSSSDKFHEAVRCFWTPRLIQKMEQDATSESSSSATKNSHNFHGNVTTSSSQPNASPQIAEISDQHTSPHDFISTNWNRPFSSYDSYSIADINNSVCDLQQFYTSQISFSELQVADSNWVDHDEAGAMWNTDELW